MKPKLTWLLAPISFGAFIATWGGWAKLASMTGYAKVEMIPGQDWSTFNIGAVLPMTVEPFGMLAISVAFNSKLRTWARVVAGAMAMVTLISAGICQVVVHYLTVNHKAVAPDPIVAIASLLPVIVLGLGAGLAILGAATRDDDGSTHGTAGPSFLGRITTALGDAAATRAERLAETTRATQRPTQADPQPAPETTHPIVPADPAPATQALPAPSQTDVPAAQAGEPDREELTRKVAELRLTTHPETGRRWSYAQIGDALGISKSTAQRLGTEAEQALPGSVDLTHEVFGTPQETASETKINGHEYEGAQV